MTGADLYLARALSYPSALNTEQYCGDSERSQLRIRVCYSVDLALTITPSRLTAGPVAMGPICSERITYEHGKIHAVFLNPKKKHYRSNDQENS